MALKRSFNDDEKIGLSSQEIELGEKYLRKNKTAGVIDETQSLKLYEMYLIGSSFSEIQSQFPQYELSKIIMTAAIRKWGIDRERMQSTLRDRVKAKVVKSVIEQVDFLTSMLGVATVEHVEQMRNYMLDPTAPKPNLRIKSIKEYKDVTETLGKIVQGATPSAKNNATSPMFDVLAPKPKKIAKNKDENTDDIDLDALLNKKDNK